MKKLLTITVAGVLMLSGTAQAEQITITIGGDHPFVGEKTARKYEHPVVTVAYPDGSPVQGGRRDGCGRFYSDTATRLNVGFIPKRYPACHTAKPRRVQLHVATFCQSPVVCPLGLPEQSVIFTVRERSSR